MEKSDQIARLRVLVEDSGLPVVRFAAKAGINPSNLSEILKKRRNLGGNVLIKIADSFNVNPQWIRNGEGEKYRTETTRVDILSEHTALYGESINYREKYINELEDQVRLLKELNQSLQKELNEKSEIIQGFLNGSIGLISKK